MKRLLIYFSVLVGCLFVGLTTYYMLKNYEYIVNTRASGEIIYLNKGETTDIVITHEKKDEDTVISHTFSNEGVASYNLETGKLQAVGGGETVLKIFSNNENLPTYEYTINVGDGSENSGWLVRTEKDLKTIGKTDKFGNAWALDATYELLNNIELKGEWEPIAGYSEVGGVAKLDYFQGTFRGNQFTISGLNIKKDAHTAGFFGAIGEHASISSINFDQVNIEGYFSYVGTLAGISNYSNVEKINVTNAKITIKENSSLALIGSNDQNNVGGIIGLNRAYVLDGSNALVADGIHHSPILMSSFSGTIDIKVEKEVATGYTIGGIVGANLGGEIRNNKANVSYIVSDVISSSTDAKKAPIGGIVGINYIHKEGETVVYAIVMNNLAIVRADKVTARMGGVIGHNGTNEDINDEVIRRTSNNMYVYSGENPLTVSYTGCLSKSSAELKDIATFEGWSISTEEEAMETASTWYIAEGSEPAINLDGTSDACEFSNQIFELNATNFASYVEKMLDNSNKITQKYWLSRQYKLTEDIDLQAIESLKVWTPISYRDTDYTFTGIFDGNGKTISGLNIKNLKEDGSVNSKAVGLFATLGTTGVIRNLIVSNINIDYAPIGGTIAGINNGSIEDCQVEAITIADAETAGFVVGYNNGTIKATKEIAPESEELSPVLQYTVLENLEGENSITSNVTNKDVYLGGITGFNKGNIVGARIQSNFTIKGATTTESSNIKMLGGIAGYNGKTIIGSSVESAKLLDLSQTYIYMGGIAGLSNGTIEKCHVGLEKGAYSASITTEINKGNQVAGGIVGQLSIDATIKQSFVNAVIKGFYVGGVAANLFGTVSETYVIGEISGEYAGGFAVNVSLSENQEKAGYVYDSYIKATMKGVTGSSRVAGLSTYIINPGKFERIIVSVKFEGEGSKYYESYTDTRTSFYNVINSFAGTKLGTVHNIVIDESLNESKAAIKNGGAINYKGQSAYYTTSEQICGGEGYFADKEFKFLEGGVWKMEATKHPILVNANLDNASQNVIEEVVEEVPAEGEAA